MVLRDDELAKKERVSALERELGAARDDLAATTAARRGEESRATWLTARRALWAAAIPWAFAAATHSFAYVTFQYLVRHAPTDPYGPRPITDAFDVIFVSSLATIVLAIAALVIARIAKRRSSVDAHLATRATWIGVATIVAFGLWSAALWVGYLAGAFV